MNELFFVVVIIRYYCVNRVCRLELPRERDKRNGKNTLNDHAVSVHILFLFLCGQLKTHEVPLVSPTSNES